LFICNNFNFNILKKKGTSSTQAGNGTDEHLILIEQSDESALCSAIQLLQENKELDEKGDVFRRNAETTDEKEMLQFHCVPPELLPKFDEVFPICLLCSS